MLFKGLPLSKQLFFLTIIYIISSGLILFLFNGTGNEADSINHYLFAKYAPVHPNLYFNHWAKPLFTLIASPFAQFGFIGVKVFNVLCGLASSILIFKICIKLKLQNPILAALFYFIFPISFLTHFSGLTEPLFAFFLSMSIYLLIEKRFLWVSILISFTPFIRSEGLFFIGLFASYFLYKRSLKSFILLGTGHFIYAVIGSFFENDFLWVFSKIPYANLESFYGSGPLFHFAEKLIYIVGVPLLIFFLLGFFRRFIPRLNIPKNEFFDVILLGFVIFFLAHSVFWYYGIFNSMGLHRVFAAVTPLMAIISLYGFNLFEFIQKVWLRRFLKFASLTYIVLFLFTSNPASIDWSKEMNLNLAQLNAIQVEKYVSSNNLESNRLIYTDPYLSEVFQIDPFDTDVRLTLSPEALTILKQNDLIIWDNWHSITDYRVELNELKFNEDLVFLKEFNNSSSQYVLFQKK